MTNVYKESVENPVHVKNLTVGTTAVKVNPQGMQFVKGILIRAPGSLDPTPNGSPCWFGPATVTADAHADTGGFPLLPGDSLFIPSEYLENLYAISDQASQNLAWMGV